MLGGYAAINSIVEGLAIQILMILSGFLSVTDQAANTIIMNIVLMMQSIGVGLASSATTFVGGQIGKQDIKSARKYYFAHFAVALLIYMISASVLYLSSDIILTNYTVNKDVLEKCH